MKLRDITSGLQFPEGPIALPDGDVLVVEIRRATLTRVAPDGRKTVVANTGGGPNGAALGPDGKVEHLYTARDAHPLRGPNDIVFDTAGGFWFTDHGKLRERDRDRTGVYYARADGSLIKEAIFPLDAPTGVGLSPDGTHLYVAETWTGRVWWWELDAPGDIVQTMGFGPGGGSLLAGLPGYQLLDSLAVDGAGNVCVATLVNGGITVIAPNGDVVEHVSTGDPLTTNICFGGPDLRTAFITLSGTGRLVATEWPRPGLRLANQ